MTPEEYVQLKAFARQDGALLSMLLIGGFACYIKGMSHPLLGLVSLLLLTVSPFFAASRLRHFRDYAREGAITFMRGYAYTVLTFFYAGLLVAVAVYVYFAFLDQGYLLGKLSTILSSEEGRQMIKIYGMADQMEEGMKTLREMRPIDFSLNMLTIIILAGFLLGLPIAICIKKVKVNQK